MNRSTALSVAFIILILPRISASYQLNRFFDSKGREWKIEKEYKRDRIKRGYLPFLPFWVYGMITKGEVDGEWYEGVYSVNLYLNEKGRWILKAKNILPEDAVFSDPREGADGSFYFVYGHIGFMIRKPLTLVKIDNQYRKRKYPVKIYNHWGFSNWLAMEVLPDNRKIIFYVKLLEYTKMPREAGIYCQILRKNYFLSDPCLIAIENVSIDDLKSQLSGEEIQLKYLHGKSESIKIKYDELSCLN